MPAVESPLRHRLRPTRKAPIPCTNPTNTHTGGVSSLPSAHQQHTTEHENDTFLCSEHVMCMSDLPNALRKAIEAWASLPEAVKAGLVVMVKATRPQ